MYNRLFILSLYALLLCAASYYKQAELSIQVLESSKVFVKGTSNVGAFSCACKDGIELQNNPIVFEKSASSIFSDNTILQLEIDQFDCGNRQLTKRMKTSLKYQSYPEIDVRINYLKISNQEKDLQNVWVESTVNIAGVAQEVCFIASKVEKQNGVYLLKSSVPLCMSDFGITPPRELNGLIKVADEISVDFELMIRIQ